jgi:hypothetical protein
MLKHLSILCLINLLNYVNIKHNYYFMYIVRINKIYEYIKYTAVLSEDDSQTLVPVNIDEISIYRSIDDIFESTSQYHGSQLQMKKPVTLISKSSLKLISSTCSSLWLTTYLFCLVEVFFNSRHTYRYKFFSPTCSFIRMRQSSYFWRKTKRS